MQFDLNHILNSTIIGNGEQNIVVIHGLFDSGTFWLPIAEKIIGNYKIHILELRNHGSFFSDSMTFQEMTDDVKNYIDYHKILKITIIGHSLGGKIAMTFAKTYPENIEKMVILDVSPLPYKYLTEYDKNTILNLNLFFKLKILNLDKFKNRLELRTSIKNEDIDFQRIVIANTKFNGQKLIWKINIDAIINNFPELIEGFDLEDFIENKIATPSLFVKAEKSDYIYPNDIKAINYIFKNSEISILQGATHRLHFEIPDKLSSIINDFLSKKN